MDRRESAIRALGVAAAACALLVGARMAVAQVIIQTVPVGNPGNATDRATGNLYGSVSYSYNIGTYDVTAAQYTAFLNAVAKTADPVGLYNSAMATDTMYGCGITQTLTAGTYTYATSKNPNFPVNYVSWGDAARFCNWLQNGQPSAPEGNGTSETGSYTLNGAITNGTLMTVTRNPEAVWCIPAENEWYKAAYYDPNKNGVGNPGYWAYPSKSNSTPSNVLSATGTNNANYLRGTYPDPTNYLTAVGAFASSPSPYGTFDQGGDVVQWSEVIMFGSYRGLRSGLFSGPDYLLQSGSRSNGTPTVAAPGIGFRISEIPGGYQAPEPASLGILSLGVLGMLVRRRGARR